MFYANVRVAKTGSIITLECQVKCIRFTLTESDLNKILDLPTVQQPDFSTNDLKYCCLAEFAKLPTSSQGSNLSYMILHHNPRLLYYILVRTILPKPNSTDSLNNRTLELIYLLMTAKPVNFARYIFDYVAKVSSIIRPAPLPYSNLLTLILKHFGIFLEHEICETMSVHVITPFVSQKHSALQS